MRETHEINIDHIFESVQAPISKDLKTIQLQLKKCISNCLLDNFENNTLQNDEAV